MSTNVAYKIKWLGFNEKPNFNRIWGHIVMADGRNFVFWGVRGKKIDFKPHHTKWRIDALINMNIRKGFKKIETDHYELIQPGFREDLEIWLTASILSDDFK